MGKIPEYQRRVFAARAVGTPGVDKSGTIIAQAVAQGAGARRQALGVMAGAEAGVLASKRQTIGVEEAGNKAVFKKLFEVGEILKQTKKIANAAALSKEKQLFASGLVTRRGETHKAFGPDPEGATKSFTEGNKEAANAHAETIKDPAVRQAFTAAAFNLTRTEESRMATWAEGQTFQKVGADAKAAFVLASEDAGSIDFTNPQWGGELNDLLGRINDVAEDNAVGLGAKADTMLIEARRTAIKRLISNNIQRNPGVALEIINSEMFASEFPDGQDGKEIQEFIKDAQDVKLAKIEKLERAGAFQLGVNRGNVMEMLINKEMNLEDINVLIQDAERGPERFPKESNQLEYLLKAKSLAKKQLAPDRPTQNAAIESITRDFRLLIVQEGEKQLGEKQKAKEDELLEGVQLEDLFLWQNRMMQMLDDGLVSSTDAKPMLKILNPFLAEEFAREQGDTTTETVGGFGFEIFGGVTTTSFVNVFDAGFSMIHHSMNAANWFDNADFDDIRAEMYKTYLRDFVSLQEQMAIVGKKPTNEDAERIAKTAFNLHKRQVTSDLLVYGVGDWYMTPLGLREIKGFFPDGAPDVILNAGDLQVQKDRVG